MLSRLKKILLITILAVASFGAGAVQAAPSLKGRILLQVESQGQAWYVDQSGYRHYLGRPNDAFTVMRALGLGISNSDLAAFKAKAPSRLAGRILIQVQDKGQAYYLNPVNLQLYYLGRPADAFDLMRSLGLGISNKNIALIPVSVATTQTSTATPALGLYTFKYQNTNFEIKQNLSSSLYDAYKNSPKVYTYNSNQEPSNLREAFYGLFLKARSGDTTLDSLVTDLKTVARNNNWSDDQLAEFTLALVQYIPYDHAKLAGSANRNNDPYYPYETLYLDRGVCSDKTFLGVSLLRKLGYGAAILDFPDLNHSAVGISCPAEYSINNSGYCYVETTNYFPLGVIPQNINSGQVSAVTDELAGIFNSANLGKIEIYQATTGKVYQGVAATKAKAASLMSAEADISSRNTAIKAQESDIKAREQSLSTMKSQMDAYYNSGQISQYNSLVVTYNNLVKAYNSALADYQSNISQYSQMIKSYNQGINDFYQK